MKPSTKLAAAVLALAPALAVAAAVYNCPRHGPRQEWQVERRGLTYVCRECENAKAQKAVADAEAARAARLSRGDILETDLAQLPSVTINTRSFGGTNLFERRCLDAIREKYVMVDGAVRLRSEFEFRCKIIQTLGRGEYLARHADAYCKIETDGAAFADDTPVVLLGGYTGELFDYTTVLGAHSRVRVFATLARLGHAVADVTLADAVAHLDAGGTFQILFRYDPGPDWMKRAGDARRRIIAAQGWSSAELPGIRATLTQQGGAIVRLKQRPAPVAEL